MPKFIFYSGHDETVFPLLRGFGQLRIKNSDPGSGLFFEFFDRDGDSMVRVFYLSQEEYLPILLPGHESYEVPTSEFKSFVDGQVSKWSLLFDEDFMSDQCKLDFKGSSDMDFFGAEQWFDKWKQFYGLPRPVNNFIRETLIKSVSQASSFEIE